MDKSLMAYFKDYVNEYTSFIAFDKKANYLYDHIDKLDAKFSSPKNKHNPSPKLPH